MLVSLLPAVTHHIHPVTISPTVSTQVLSINILSCKNILLVTLTPFSSRAASGLLMLLTNLLTCSKCLVISVASTISMMACRSVRYSFLRKRKERKITVWLIAWNPSEQFSPSDCSDSGHEWKLCSPSPSEGSSICELFCFRTQVTLLCYRCLSTHARTHEFEHEWNIFL